MVRVFSISLLMCAALLAPNASSAQFGVTPTDSLVEMFTTDSLTRIFQIDFPNQTEDSLALSWRWIDGGWTDGWDVNLCDLGECYTGIPNSADMMSCPADGAGYLKLLVNALSLEGECVLHFWVWPTGNPDALVNVYYDLRNGAVSQVSSALAEVPLVAWPNPVQVGTQVVLSGSDTQTEFSSFTMQRLDPLGTLHFCDVEGTAQGWRISTQGWSSGLHLLRAGDSGGLIRLIVQ